MPQSTKARQRHSKWHSPPWQTFFFIWLHKYKISQGTPSTARKQDLFRYLRMTFSIRASQVVLVVKNLPANAGDARNTCLTPWSGRSPGEGNGNPLQYSGLGNPMDRGAWWATVHGVAKRHDLAIKQQQLFRIYIYLYSNLLSILTIILYGLFWWLKW